MIVSSTVGSRISTGWKRRSSAGSFSTFLRYSSIVVAPITWSSPRASAGFSMLEASIAPSAAPAPTTVCSSSMKTIIWSPLSRISSITDFRRSSNSPRYFVPAIIPERSSATRRRPARVSGTSSLTMRWAMPSTIAVLPTPGSPMSTGLFFVRRERISTVCSISSARPITGSSLPSRASSVRSRLYSSTVLVVLRSLACPSRSTPRTTRPRSLVCERPNFRRVAPASASSSRASDSRTCSGPDVRGAELHRLLVRPEDGALGVRRERGRHVERLTLLGRVLDLRGDRLGVCPGLFEQVHDHLVAKGSVQEVIRVEFEAPPRRGRLRGPLEELPRRVAEQLGDVDLFDPRRGRTAPGAAGAPPKRPPAPAAESEKKREKKSSNIPSPPKPEPRPEPIRRRSARWTWHRYRVSGG